MSGEILLWIPLDIHQKIFYKQLPENIKALFGSVINIGVIMHV
jgi:hypothetical protein